MADDNKDASRLIDEKIAELGDWRGKTLGNVRRLIKDDFDRAFAECDVVAGPTAPTPAFRLGEKADDPLAMYLADIYTVTANLAGVPGITVPCGNSRDGLPIGLQILGKHFDEATVLKTGHVVEHALAGAPVQVGS